VAAWAGISLATPVHRAAASEAAVAEVARAAYVADYRGGITRLRAMVGTDPRDIEALLGVGALQFLGAFATLQEGLWQHAGMEPSASARQLGRLSRMLPTGMFFGTPALVPPNPNATPMTYTALRGLVKRFAEDLAVAEASLAKLGDRPVKLPVDPFQIALDLNHDGRIEPHERLLAAFSGRAPEGTTIAFDTADASWLRGYANLLMASANLLLACDFERSYEAVGHNMYGLAATAFGRALKRQSEAAGAKAELEAIDARLQALAQSPNEARRREIIRQMGTIASAQPLTVEQKRLSEEMARLTEADQARQREVRALMLARIRLIAGGQQRDPGDWSGVLDLVAFVHTMSWPVVEPERLKAVRTHLLQVMAINRETWRLVRAETDDDREWLPSARQTAAIGGRHLTDEVIDSWLATTALAEQVLKGEKLLAHPRFTKGVNLKKLLETAPRIDVVMMIAGQDLAPYLESGEIADGLKWQEITRPMQQNLWLYALWFN
ncbi:MAG: hypothetical protein AB7O57_07810, partial [Hyphomicrobiaceae bacterium]